MKKPLNYQVVTAELSRFGQDYHTLQLVKAELSSFGQDFKGIYPPYIGAFSRDFPYIYTFVT
jgi:hypothetical protein